MAETKPILQPPQQPGKPGLNQNALYQDSAQDTQSNVLQVGIIVVLTLMFLTTISLSIYRGIVLSANGALYFMLGSSVVGLVIIELIMIWFIRHSDFPKSKSWFLYFIALCTFLEALFTDILLFQ